MNTSQVIDALGGTAKVARLCEVEMAAVSQWRHSGIPNARLMFLKLARSHVFQEFVEQTPQQDVAREWFCTASLLSSNQ